MNYKDWSKNLESKEKEINISVETEKTEEVTTETKPVDGYHNPKDLKMIRSLQFALRQAGEEIKNMQKENEQQKDDLSEKESLISEASIKLDDQENLIQALKLEKEEIIANKGSVKMQEEISKAIEFGNQIKREAEEEGLKRKEEIISSAEEKAKTIISEAEKEAKLAEEREEKANIAFHKVTADIQKYQEMFAAILSQKDGVPNPAVVEPVKEDSTDKEKEVDSNINDETKVDTKEDTKTDTEDRSKDKSAAEGLWGTVPTSSQGSEKKLPGKPKVKSEAQMRLEKQLKK